MSQICLSLLSGLIGALIATVLSILYQAIWEKKKIRADVLMEVVSYCDEIYSHLQSMYVHKDHEYGNKKPALQPEEYRIISNALTKLLVSTKVSAKLAIGYGEGNIMALFNELKACFQEVTSMLRKATRDDWLIKEEEISNLFSGKIERLRNNLQREILNEYKAIQIVKGFFRSSI